MKIIQTKDINDFQIKTLEETHKIEINLIQPFGVGVGKQRRYIVLYKENKSEEELQRVYILEQEESLYKHINKRLNKERKRKE